MGPFRLVSLLLMAAFYVLAGVMHFAAPGFYVQIMPASLPCPLFLVYLSGMCEIGLGLLLLVPRLRIWAAWGVILLLLAVFPANVNMAVHHLIPQGMPPWVPRPSTMALWLRLPMQ